MNPPTSIVCADTGGPCEVCAGACWAFVDGHRVHVITCWPMLEETNHMTPTDVIVDAPLRCFNQAVWICQQYPNATIHATERFLGRATPKRPGMGSGCMPVDPRTGADRCRHDLAQLRRASAVDLTPDVPCADEPCPTCERQECA